MPSCLILLDLPKGPNLIKSLGDEPLHIMIWADMYGNVMVKLNNKYRGKCEAICTTWKCSGGGSLPIHPEFQPYPEADNVELFLAIGAVL